MINNKTIAVIVPCFNEETQINQVIDTMPDFVDRIIIINDKSTDKTAEIVKKYIDNNDNRAIEINSILDKINPIITTGQILLFRNFKKKRLNILHHVKFITIITKIK